MSLLSPISSKSNISIQERHLPHLKILVIVLIASLVFTLFLSFNNPLSFHKWSWSQLPLAIALLSSLAIGALLFCKQRPPKGSPLIVPLQVIAPPIQDNPLPKPIHTDLVPREVTAIDTTMVRKVIPLKNDASIVLEFPYDNFFIASSSEDKDDWNLYQDARPIFDILRCYKNGRPAKYSLHNAGSLGVSAIRIQKSDLFILGVLTEFYKDGSTTQFALQRELLVERGVEKTFIYKIPMKPSHTTDLPLAYRAKLTKYVWEEFSDQPFLPMQEPQIIFTPQLGILCVIKWLSEESGSEHWNSSAVSFFDENFFRETYLKKKRSGAYQLSLSTTIDSWVICWVVPPDVSDARLDPRINGFYAFYVDIYANTNFGELMEEALPPLFPEFCNTVLSFIFPRRSTELLSKA